MKKRRLLLSTLCLFALSITGCNFTLVESKSSSLSQSVSSVEIKSSSVLDESSSSQAASSSETVSSSSSKSSAASSSSSKSSSSEKSSSKQSSSSSSSSSSSKSSSSSSSSSSSKASSSSNSSSSKSSSSSSSSSSSAQTSKHVSLDIFALNDTHGNVTDTEGKGLGLGKTTTALKELSANKNSIFISQGDMWQGSVESNYTKGYLVTEWMNSMDFVSMTIGNHEFDWGQQRIKDNVALAEFPFLGINVLYRSNNQRVDYLRPSTTFTRDGAKIGVIGAIGDCLSSISSGNVQDIYFAWGDYLSNMVKAEATRLRNEEHCDFIIYSVHGALYEDGDYDQSLSNGYVDLVLEGHSHHNYCDTDDYGVYHVQCYGYNQNIYQITVDLDLTNKTYEIDDVVSRNFSYSYSPYKNYPEDSGVKALFDKYYDQYAIAYKELGVVTDFKGRDELRNKLADLYYEKGLEKWGSSYDVCLGGGYMSCRANGIGPGMVTYGEVAECFPFDNEIVLCSVSGSDFVNTQYITGSSNYFVTWKDSSLQYMVDYSETYYLVTDTYTSDFYSSFTVIDYLNKGNVYARDLLANYIEAGNWDETPPQPQGQHDGTIGDPKTIAEALELASLYTSATASQAFYFKGTVNDFAESWNSSYGDLKNVKVCDAGEDNEMLIYYLKKFSGATPSNGNWTSVDDLVPGDVIIFYGKPYTYYGTPEFGTGTYVYSINGVVTGQNY